MDVQYFLIGTDGRHYGPLSADDVRVWLADGRASRYSRARRTTEDHWLALREMPEFEEATRPPYVGGGIPPGADQASAEAYDGLTHDDERTLVLPLDPISCF